MKFVFLLILSLISLPGLCQEEDDLIEKLEQDKKKQAEVAVKIDKAHEDIKASVFNAPAELKKIGYEKLNPEAFLDPKVIGVVQQMFRENPIRKLSRADAKKQILDRLKEGKVKNYFLKNPKITDGIVDLIQDSEAIPSLIGIFLKKAELKLYGCIWIVLIILTWLFKKIFFNKHWTRGKSILMGLMTHFFVTVISIGIFYYLFQKEIAPSVRIISRYF